MNDSDFKIASDAYLDLYSFKSNAERGFTFNNMLEQLQAPYADLFKNTFDFSCGPGWWPHLQVAFQELAALNAQYPGFHVGIAQIKEKFGDLRFYTHTVSLMEGDTVPDELYEAISAVVRKAESACVRRCEICGAAGEHTNSNWIKTLCPEHDELRKRGWKKE